LQVQVTLHSILRERLPPEAKGQASFDLPTAESLGDLMGRLGITQRVFFTVNGKLETDPQRMLADGDQVNVYVPVHGG